ncbi:trypsin-like serine protease [Hoeflea sp. AS60]|uniref:S1 family peptidase n=1 Tax=Hoeflea sp. AS60 TaxID=3135780 RepID=UPI00317A7527
MKGLFLSALIALFLSSVSPAITQDKFAEGEGPSAKETMLLRQEKMRDGSEKSGQRMVADKATLDTDTPLYIDGDPVFQNWVATVKPIQTITLDSGDADAQDSSVRIRSIGGNRVRPGQLTQVAALLLRNNRPVCSATAISRRHFLTAAHCFCGSSQPVTIAFGDDTSGGFTRAFGTSFRLVEGAQDMDCSNYVSLRRTIGGSDLAVVELNQDVGELYLKSPAALPNAADIANIEQGTTAVIAGYGRRSTNPRSRSFRIGVKNYLVSPIVDVTCDGNRYDCVEGREIVSRDTRTGGVGPCSGDSGGAMFVKSEKDSGPSFVLVAVVSRMARSNLRCGDAVVFSLLSSENISQIEALLK